MTKMRSGEQYRASLADGRSVYVDGEKVAVGSHPGFAGIVSEIASLIDLLGDPAAGLVVDDQSVGGPANWIYLTPHTRGDLAARRRAVEALARPSMGFVGRGPDHVAGFFAGFAAYPELFDKGAGAGGRPSAGDNVRAFRRRMARESLYCTYCIIPPSIDRALAAEGAPDRTQVHLVSERDDGIVIDGAQILGTGTAVSDWLFLSCMVPLKEGQERFALSLVLPVATLGMRVHCRRPYAGMATSVWDYPLTSRFDETDAVVTFHEVFVPWEQVFVCGDVDLVRRQFHSTPAHILGNTQAQVRLAVKLKFLLGLALKVTEATGASSGEAQDQVAELLALAAHVEGMVLASEYEARVDDHGVAVPDPRYLYAAMSTQAEVYPRALHLLRLLSSSQIINLPSSHLALRSPLTREDLLAGSTSPRTPGEQRLKLFKLVWDVVGSELASRHHQYEMFYAGAPAVGRNYARQRYRLEEAAALADEFLAGYR
ncbi:MAG: 4-hydroxyphenylacetate 3-hydroxylase family protein [Acidimicrobiales bacterium]